MAARFLEGILSEDKITQNELRGVIKMAIHGLYHLDENCEKAAEYDPTATDSSDISQAMKRASIDTAQHILLRLREFNTKYLDSDPKELDQKQQYFLTYPTNFYGILMMHFKNYYSPKAN